MLIIEHITAQFWGVAQVGAVLGAGGVPFVVWLRRRGKTRIVNWAREALTHPNGDGGDNQLLTVTENNKVAGEINESISAIGSRLFLSELSMNARLDLHDAQADRLEASVQQLTAVLLHDPREKNSDGAVKNG